MMQFNMITLTRLTKLLLPGMLKRGRGKILNIASTAALMPGPLMAVYYATKAYVLSFSEPLNEEVSGTGVSVTALCPGPTKTRFQTRARTVALEGFKGLMRGTPLVIPGLMNKVQAHAPRFLPRRIVPATARRAQESGGAQQ